MEKILIIEDETSIQNILKVFLEEAGYQIYLANDGVSGLTEFRKVNPDLVLLDLMLPKMNGYAVCEILRNESTTPIIMLTALDDESSQVKGFNLHADDYITKPFSVHLVLCRIEAVLRRYHLSENNTNIIHYKDLLMDMDSYEVFRGTELISLTAREFEILKLFLENQGRVFSREQLLDIIWNYEFIGDEKIINTHMKNIRKKMGVNYIETIRGVGYKIEKENKKQCFS